MLRARLIADTAAPSAVWAVCLGDGGTAAMLVGESPEKILP